MTPRVTLAELRRLAKSRGLQVEVALLGGGWCAEAFRWSLSGAIQITIICIRKAPSREAVIGYLAAALRALPQAGKERKR